MDWLSIVSIVVSCIGVILSLLLFNASVNNGRKSLLNDIISFIQQEVFFMFTDLTPESEKLKKRINFDRAMIKIDKEIGSIRYNKKGVPILGAGQKTNVDGTVTSTLYVKNAYTAVMEYFKSQHLDGIDLLLETYDDRVYMLQHYNEKRIYKRRFLIGPIYGLRIIYIRRHKTASYTSKDSTEIAVKKIKNFKDFRKYYDLSYSKFPYIEKLSFAREIKDVEIITSEKDKPIVITLYKHVPFQK